MNLSTAVFLINKHVRAVAVEYEPHQKRTIYKTLDADMKIGDFVVVPTTTRHQMTVVKVVDVDIDVDFESDIQIGWVIDKVDKTSYDTIVEQEATAIKVVAQAEFKRKRDDLAKILRESNSALLKDLSLADKPEDDLVGI